MNDQHIHQQNVLISDMYTRICNRKCTLYVWTSESFILQTIRHLYLPLIVDLPDHDIFNTAIYNYNDTMGYYDCKGDGVVCYLYATRITLVLLDRQTRV